MNSVNENEMLCLMNEHVTGCRGDLGVSRPQVVGARAVELDVDQAEGSCRTQTAPQDSTVAPRGAGAGLAAPLLSPDTAALALPQTLSGPDRHPTRGCRAVRTVLAHTRAPFSHYRRHAAIGRVPCKPGGSPVNQKLQIQQLYAVGAHKPSLQCISTRSQSAGRAKTPVCIY